MMIKPAILVRMDNFEEKKVPIQVAEAPRRMNTILNPPIKKRAFSKKLLSFLANCPEFGGLGILAVYRNCANVPVTCQ